MPLTEADYQVILARVKQKIATEAEWLLVEDELGLIFEGEQAFVVSEGDRLPVNFKIGDGTKKFSELPYFITYLDSVQSLRKASYINQSSDITISATFRNYSNLYGIAIVNNSGGSIPLKVGTTNGGGEILDIDVDLGAVFIERNFPFTQPETLYLTGLNGNNYSLFILWYQHDESPASVPSPASGTRLYNKGTMGMFVPLYDGHLNEAWDFVTGYGKPESGYDNCVIMGTNGTPNMEGKYPVGYETGQNVGVRVGNTDNTAPILKTNLPAEGIGLFVDEVGNANGNIPTTNDKVARALGYSGGDAFAKTLNYELTKSVGSGTTFVGKSQNLGNGTEMDIQPDSLTVLYFIAVE